MALRDIARAHYAAQAALADRTSDQLLLLWALLDPAGLAASWAALRLVERMLVVLASAQWAAAARAARYVPAALIGQGSRSAPQGRVAVRALVGVASDGRDLQSLLTQPLIRTLFAIREGASPATALRMGGSALRMIATTQVGDAGRVAERVAMAAEPQATGWVRMLVPPACGRCAVLAGKTFRWNEGFERHPNCDCIHIPAAEQVAGDLRTDPRLYFESLSAADQDRHFTVAGAEAIRAGADIGRVVNARRGAAGLSRPGRLTRDERRLLAGPEGARRLRRVDALGRQVLITVEGTARPGVAGRSSARAGGDPGRRGRMPRLMPEAIAELAGDNREQYVRLLRLYGYLTT